MITTVSSSSQLNAAIKAAQAGDTIQLAAGTYAGIVATNDHFATDVTVTSADPAHQAVITDLMVSASNGLTFSGLELQANAAGGDNPFKVNSSQDIHFDHLNVHGSLDGDPQNDVAGFLIRGSSDVSVTNSEFQQLHHAIAQLDNDHLTISGNAFHDIRTDGVRGGGSSNVTVSSNTFTNFFPVAGDHGDAIQFWTSNTTASAHDIIITDNLFLRGSGGVAQGVFVTDQVGNLPYIHLTITNNFIIGGMFNGISVNDAQGVTIDHNVVAGFTDMNSWIRLDNVAGATVTNNSANQFLTNATDSNIVMSNDIVTPRAADSGAAAYALWQTAHNAPLGLSLVGTTGADTLTGGAFADTLNGVSGADLLTGGAGDDLYVTDGKASIVEAANSGTDTAQSTGSYTLASNVENLVFTGTANTWGGGNGLNNQITGNSGANHLSGAGGNDTIDGGAGADVITGGKGDDGLTGGTGADTFVFAKGDGHDVIHDFGAGGEHDVIDISALMSLGLQPALADTAAGATISFASGDQILLEGLHVASLHATATGFIF